MAEAFSLCGVWQQVGMPVGWSNFLVHPLPRAEYGALHLPWRFRQHLWELLAPRGYETIQPRAWCCLAQTQLCVTSVPAHVLVLEGTEPAFSLFWVTWLPSQPCLAMELMRGCGSGAGPTPARGEYSRAINYTHVERALLLAP